MGKPKDFADLSADIMARRLEVRRTPDPVTHKRHRYRGARTGKTIRQMWCLLFRLNEELPIAKKMTDTEIGRQMQLEFPDSVEVESIVEERPNATKISTLRIRYNKGLLGNERPEKLSRRYDHLGRPIKPHHHTISSLRASGVDVRDLLRL